MNRELEEQRKSRTNILIAILFIGMAGLYCLGILVGYEYEYEPESIRLVLWLLMGVEITLVFLYLSYSNSIEEGEMKDEILRDITKDIDLQSAFMDIMIETYGLEELKKMIEKYEELSKR